MKDKVKIVDFDECDTWRMKEKGLGGVRGFVKTKDDAIYIVKPESLNQTLNEIMAQIVINSLGLEPIEYAFVLINGTHYGALRYLNGLKRIGKKNYKTLTKQQKIEFLKHLFLNAFLNNEDICGEIYLTEEGKVASLDYGDAGVKIPLFNIDKISDSDKNIVLALLNKKPDLHDFVSCIRVYVNTVNECYLDDTVDLDELKKIIIDMVDGFINSDYSEYEAFLKELMTLHSELHAFIYQEHLNGLIEAAEELKANLNKLFDDMPA